MKRRFNKDRSVRSLTDGKDSGRRGARRNVVHRVDLPSSGGAGTSTGRFRSARGRRQDPPLTPQEDAAVRAQRLPELAAMLLAGDSDQPLRARLRSTFVAMGYEGGDLAALEEGLLALMVREVTRKHEEELKAKRPTGVAEDPDSTGQPEEGDELLDPDLYQRRIAKLMSALDESRAELGRLQESSKVDPGLASIYRDVQGLSGEAKDASAKREMMAVLFEANLELKNDLREQS
jgi:hypothetical protein